MAVLQGGHRPAVAVQHHHATHAHSTSLSNGMSLQRCLQVAASHPHRQPQHRWQQQQHRQLACRALLPFSNGDGDGGGTGNSGGGDGADSTKRKTTKGTATTSSRPRPPSPPPPHKQQRQQPAHQQQPQQQNKQTPPQQQPQHGKASGLNAVEEAKLRRLRQQRIREHPVLGRLQDGTLMLGDLVMVVATEVSSDRVPLAAMPELVGVAAACWLAAGTALGDYKGDPPYIDNFYVSLLGPSFVAILNATITWALSMTAALAAYAALVANGLVEAAPLMEDLSPDELSPQLEVLVALLITMSCWRGIVARLRW